MNNFTNLVGENGVKVNILLDREQIIMLSVFIFLAFFLAVLLANLLINSLKK